MDEHYFGDMRFLEVSPPIALKPFLNRYYLYENLDERFRRCSFCALPNGMVEIVLLFNNNRVIFITKRQKLVLSGFIAGIFELNHSMKLKVEVNGKPLRGISVLLTHLGVNRILGVNLCELTNKVIAFSSFGWAALSRLHHDVMEMEETREKLKNLNDFFLSQITVNCHACQRILIVLNHLEHMSGPLTVERVAGEFSLSYKSLYRMFVEEVGLTPKMYLKILRFNLACRMLSRQPSVSWADLVDRCGYYDQSHFIHEFKAIMKKSPLQYLKSSRGSFYLNRPYVFR